MPGVVLFFLRLALKIALPQVEQELSLVLANVIKHINGQENQPKAVADLKAHLDVFHNRKV